jgi:hypothetical protein
MTRHVRWVVSGHDANERAVVKIDELERRCQETFLSRSAHSRSTPNVRGFSKPHSRPRLPSVIIYFGGPESWMKF